jgi:hypothetical protein
MELVFITRGRPCQSKMEGNHEENQTESTNPRGAKDAEKTLNLFIRREYFAVLSPSPGGGCFA